MSTMTFNLLYTAAGVGLLVLGGVITQAFVRARAGRVDPVAMEAVRGTGAVPRWVSYLVLAGWFVLGTGLLAVLAGLLGGS
jgi:hypothetical protein